MALPPELTDQPIFDIAGASEIVSAVYDDAVNSAAPPTTTLASAWSDIITARGDFIGDEGTPLNLMVVTNQKKAFWFWLDPDPYSYSPYLHFIDYRAAKMRLRVRLYTATCYFKLWWTKKTYVDAVVATTTTESWTWTPVGDSVLGLPNGWDASNLATWRLETIGDYEPDEPPDPVPPADPGGHPGSDYEVADGPYSTAIALTEFRWSVLPGYTPPSDGSANGFPVF